MTEMTMNRAIHAAVRRDLDRLDAALGGFADGDRHRADGLLRGWNHLDAQLRKHHQQEDELIWPTLLDLGVDPVLLGEMEEEHQQMADALQRTDAAMQRFGGTASRPDALSAAESVEATRVVVERHLQHEEQELEPQLRPHLETPQWRAAEKQLRKGSPVEGGRMFAWLLDGSAGEADRFVRGLMPRPVLFVLARVLGAGYHRSVAPVWRT
jgi:hypothetical protein